MSAPLITSRQHPLVQRCRRLAAGQGDPGDILLDGEHLVREAATAGVPMVAVLADERHQALQAWLSSRGVGSSTVSDRVIAAASPVRSPAGVVAIARWAPAPVSDVLVVAADRPTRLVAMVDLQDPGNVGTIIRSAAAFGASGVLVLGASANPAAWRTLRAAMGSTFRMPIATGESRPTLAAARQAGIRLVAATAQGGNAPSDDALSPPALILIGSEGRGLPDDIVAMADEQVTLPMRGGVESINAATTASVLLWEMARRHPDTVRR